MNLLQKLLEIRKSVEYIQKTEHGNQGAMYVDPAALVKKIRSKMDDHKILLIPRFVNSDVEQIDSPTKNNANAKAFFFKASFEYWWMDTESEDKLNVPWFITGKHATDPAMAEGAALTYNERYFLLKFFQIPTSKDDPEYFKEKTKEPEPPKEITIGEDNLAWLMTFCKDQKITSKKDKDAFKVHYAFEPYETTREEFKAVKSKIKADYNDIE
jgi:hypothetical protein